MKAKTVIRKWKGTREKAPIAMGVRVAIYAKSDCEGPIEPHCNCYDCREVCDCGDYNCNYDCECW